MVKLLKHKDTEKVWLVMHQNKTFKICANHTVVPSISLQEHHNSVACVRFFGWRTERTFLHMLVERGQVNDL